MPKTAPSHWRDFVVTWIGQLFSLVGSGLTGFALGIWVYQTTGSVTQFALISLFTKLPGIVLSPVAGALVDRWDRRRVMILSDTGSGLCTLGIVILLATGNLQVWHIYVAMGLSSCCSAFQWPAYSAAVSLLVSKEHYGRASGMAQLGEAVAEILSPSLAGVLIGVVGLQGIIMIDFGTFLIAFTTLLIIRIPKPATSSVGLSGHGSLLSEAALGWRYIVTRPGLLGILIVFALTNFSSSIVSVLLTPLVLGFSTTAALGTVLSVGGLGFLGGGLTMSAWGGPRRRARSVYIFLGLQALALFVAALPWQIALLAGAALFYNYAHSIAVSCNQALWQAKTPPDVQGRVFAFRRMIAWSTRPLAYVAAGPLADRLFEPLMAVGGPLASSVGRVLGTGPGRGIALLFVLLAGSNLLTVTFALLIPRTRRVDIELPDHDQLAPPEPAILVDENSPIM